MIDEIRKIKSGKKELREFGFVMAAFFFIIGGIAAFRGRAHYPYLLSAGGVFGLAALFCLVSFVILPYAFRRLCANCDNVERPRKQRG